MIEVLSAGIFSSIQDQGRFGFRHLGVPVSGAMDHKSANLANALLNNDEDCAVLEATIVGPSLKFHQLTFIAITGADCVLLLNNEVIKMNSVIKVNKHDVLKIAKALNGVRCYLAVAGGFQTAKVLNSRGYYQGITKCSQIKKGDSLSIVKQVEDIINRTSIKADLTQIKNHLQVTHGPEFALLDKRCQQELFNKGFKISNQSNRMAYKLEHNTKLKAKEIITSSVQPGCVQLTPAGELIVLMRDCQTTGGYARVLQLTENSINYLAQMSVGEIIKFRHKKAP